MSAHPPESAHKDPHAKEAHGTKEVKHDDKAGKTVEKKAEETKKAVHNVVPEAHGDAHDAHSTHGAHESIPAPHYAPLPKAPGLSTFVKGATLPAAVLAPAVVAPLAVGGFFAKKAWGLASKVPGLNLLTRGAERAATGVKEGLSNTASVAAYPFKATLAMGRNALTFANHNILQPPLRLLKWGAKELYVDTRHLVEKLAGIEANKMNPVNLLTGTVGIATNGIKNLASWGWHHPKTAVVGGLMAAGYLGAYGFPGAFSVAAADAFGAAKGLFSWISTWGSNAPIPRFGIPGL